MIRICDCEETGCPGDWEQLPESGDVDMRCCTACFRAVYRCHVKEEVFLRKQAGQVAALVSNKSLPS